jgi:hypothetical protein
VSFFAKPETTFAGHAAPFHTAEPRGVKRACGSRRVASAKHAGRGGRGGGDDAEGAELAAVAVAGFAAVGLAGGLVRAAGGFLAPALAAAATGSSSAKTGLGEITVVGVVPASPDCSEPDSFTATRTGILCG